jgi:hypothetical protein
MDAGVPLVLEWSAPAGCPSEAGVRQRIETILGRPPRAMTPVAASAVARRTAEGRWEVSLVVRGPGEGVAGRRRFDAESCDAAADATALIVALMVDPEHAIVDVPAAPPPPPLPPRAFAPPAPRPPADAPPPLPLPSTAPAPPARLPLHLSMHVAVGLDTATVGRAVAGLEGAAAATLSHASLEARGAVWAPATETPPSRPDEGASLGMWTLGARGAYEVGWGDLRVGALAGVEMDRVSAGGFGGTSSSTKDAVWSALELGGRAAWRFGRRFALSWALEGVAPASRPSFVAVQSRGPALIVDRPPGVAARSFVGVVCRFF